MSARNYKDPHGRAIQFAIPDGLDVHAAKEVWDSALCAQVDPEIFFPEKGKPPTEARKVCNACTVRTLCLDVFGDLLDFGVVGGLTGRERRARRLGENAEPGEAA